LQGSANLFVTHDREKYFGGVVMFPVPLFRQINGYSNGYWGWGYEDTDMRIRCRAEQIALGYRDGTFDPLRHTSHGYQPDGKPNEIHQANRALCERNAQAIRDRKAHHEDGLNSLRFDLLARSAIADSAGHPYPHAERVLVRL